jgi:hypothetical protein
MEVSSRLTGRRGVSLPFSDFCFPLVSTPEDAARLQAAALEVGRRRGWKYLEFRGACGLPKAKPSLEFFTHVVDLKGDAKLCFQRLESPVRRAIRKAENAQLHVEFEATAEAASTYYHLHCLTRKRHGLPPQPVEFFERIAQHIFCRSHGFVAIARHANQPVAASVFFHQGSEAIYKYGASDSNFQHLRGSNLVMWAAIKHLASLGAQYLHLGRTSLGNDGLRRFKLGFGAKEGKISYFRYDYRTNVFVADTDRAQSWVNRIFREMPIPLLRLAGKILYPHLSLILIPFSILIVARHLLL